MGEKHQVNDEPGPCPCLQMPVSWTLYALSRALGQVTDAALSVPLEPSQPMKVLVSVVGEGIVEIMGAQSHIVTALQTGACVLFAHVAQRGRLFQVKSCLASPHSNSARSLTSLVYSSWRWQGAAHTSLRRRARRWPTHVDLHTHFS